jgi:hypothetical protein
MAEIFISFIHEEVDYAQAVQNFISRILGAEVTPFLSFDKFQIYAGEKWIERIMDELKGAKVVVLMLSKESVKRPWVNFEAGAAWTRDIDIIPVCILGLSKDDLPKPYSSLQAISLGSNGDDEYMARSVAHYLGLPEPSGRMNMYRMAAAALGGPESERQAAQENAYKSLDEELKCLENLGPIRYS